MMWRAHTPMTLAAQISHSDRAKGRIEERRAVTEGRSKREGEIVFLIVIGWRVQMRILEGSII